MSTQIDLESAVKQARERLDEHTYNVVQRHFHESTGCPFWLGKKAEMNFDPLFTTSKQFKHGSPALFSRNNMAFNWWDEFLKCSISSTRYQQRNAFIMKRLYWSSNRLGISCLMFKANSNKNHSSHTQWQYQSRGATVQGHNGSDEVGDLMFSATIRSVTDALLNQCLSRIVWRLRQGGSDRRRISQRNFGLNARVGRKSSV